MYIQIINSIPLCLLSKAGDVLLITTLVDGVPGEVTRATTHPVGEADINASHLVASVAESERTALGIYPVTPDAGFDSDRYSSTGKTYAFDGSNGIEAHTLVEHSIADLRARKVAVLEADYETACDDGFSSGALGATHNYGSTDRQVVDLLGAITFNASLPFGCRDASLVRVRPTHTTAQLKQVLTDGATVKLGYHSTLTTKLDAIEAADDYATLNAITWSF